MYIAEATGCKKKKKHNSKKCKSQSREDDRVQTQVPGSTGAA
jgi:hypothetical protein